MLAIIKSLIQTDPKKRPTTDEILSFPLVKKKIKEFNLFEDDDIMQSPEVESNLLQTIYIPKNLVQLKDKLPKASYTKDF